VVRDCVSYRSSLIIDGFREWYRRSRVSCVLTSQTLFRCCVCTAPEAGFFILTIMKKKYGVFKIDTDSDFGNGYGKTILIGSLRDTEEEALQWLDRLIDGLYVILVVYQSDGFRY
jgi:hypothetical protein